MYSHVFSCNLHVSLRMWLSKSLSSFKVRDAATYLNHRLAKSFAGPCCVLPVLPLFYSDSQGEGVAASLAKVPHLQVTEQLTLQWHKLQHPWKSCTMGELRHAVYHLTLKKNKGHDWRFSWQNNDSYREHIQMLYHQKSWHIPIVNSKYVDDCRQFFCTMWTQGSTPMPFASSVSASRTPWIRWTTNSIRMKLARSVLLSFGVVSNMVVVLLSTTDPFPQKLLQRILSNQFKSW